MSSEFKWFQDLNQAAMQQYYKSRGDYEVEYLDSPSLKEPPLRLKVTDRYCNEPVGWVVLNRWGMDSDGGLIDPIYQYTVDYKWLNLILASRLFSGNATVYVSIGRYHGSYLTLTGIDEATDLMISCYYTNEQIFDYKEKELAGRGMKYYSGITHNIGQFSELDRTITDYERFVLPLPDDYQSHQQLLQWAIESYQVRQQQLTGQYAYWQECEKLRPLFAAQKELAKLNDCQLDVESDPYHAELYRLSDPVKIYPFRYSLDELARLIQTITQS